MADRLGSRDAPGRRLPSLGPPGHVGASAHSTPRGDRAGTGRNVSAYGGHEGAAIPPAPDCEALQDSRSRALATLASLCDPFGTQDRDSCQGFNRRLYGGWPRPSVAHRCSPNPGIQDKSSSSDGGKIDRRSSSTSNLYRSTRRASWMPTSVRNSPSAWPNGRGKPP
jgi:hypothetical protein